MQNENKPPLSVYKKLLDVKKQVSYIKKDKKGFNYDYASPSAVFGQLNPILNELGLLLITNVTNTKSYEIAPKMDKQGKLKAAEWKFDLDFTFDWVCVETGEKVSIPFSASGCNGDDKGLGSALTYAERYFVLKQFNIPTDNDDPDSFQDKHMSVEDKKLKKDEEERAQKEAYDKAVLEAKALLQTASNVEELGAKFKSLSPAMQKATSQFTTELKTALTPATA